MIRGEMALSASEMGMLLSAFSMAYAFSQLLVGVLLDRFGARLTLGADMCTWSIAQLCGAFVTSLQQFFIARAFLGIGESPQFPAGAKVIGEWFNMKDRRAPTGIFVAASTIGPALAPPMLTGLMLALGWQNMFILTGILGFLVSSMVLLVKRPSTSLATRWRSIAAWLKKSYEKHGHAVGVGAINWNDAGKRDALRENLGYLAGAEQYVMIKGAERIRTFDMGQVSKKVKSGRPRVDPSMRVSGIVTDRRYGASP